MRRFKFFEIYYSEIIVKEKKMMNEKKSIFGQKSNKAKYIVLILLLVLILLVVTSYLIFFRDGKQPGEGKNSLKDTVKEIKLLEEEIAIKNKRIFSIYDDYKKKTNKPLQINPFNLTDEEMNFIKDKIKNEQDITIKGFINEILKQKKDISKLKERINKLESVLPKPYVAREGQTHYKIAYNFLLNSGVSEDEIPDLMRNVVILPRLESGFYVWNFLKGDEYITAVTQGIAAISPGEILEDLYEEKSKLEESNENLKNDNKLLTSKNLNLTSKNLNLKKENNDLKNENIILVNKNIELVKRITSVFFYVARREKLIKDKVLKQKFLQSPQLKNLPEDSFQNSIDLTESDIIKISAKPLYLIKIQDVKIYPDIFVKDKDYRVIISSNRKDVEIKILNIKKLAGQKIIIAVK